MVNTPGTGVPVAPLTPPWEALGVVAETATWAVGTLSAKSVAPLALPLVVAIVVWPNDQLWHKSRPELLR